MNRNAVYIHIVNRIMIIGCCGSGKSTLSHRIRQVTNLPLYHLDQYYWKPNWTETPREEWEPIVSDLAARDEWIIDGNYGGTMEIRIRRADTIIFMDISTVTCLWRVLIRTWKNYGRERPDMPEGCKERFDFDFLHYVAMYNMLRRKKYMSMMERLKVEKSVYIIRSDKDVERMLEEFRRNTSVEQSEFMK